MIYPLFFTSLRHDSNVLVTNVSRNISKIIPYVPKKKRADTHNVKKMPRLVSAPEISCCRRPGKSKDDLPYLDLFYDPFSSLCRPNPWIASTSTSAIKVENAAPSAPNFGIRIRLNTKSSTAPAVTEYTTLISSPRGVRIWMPVIFDNPVKKYRRHQDHPSVRQPAGSLFPPEAGWILLHTV